MTKPKPAAQADAPAAADAPIAVSSAETSLATPAPSASEPSSGPTPPDNNGDGQPGGSDALQPYAVLRATVRGVPAGHVVYGPREEIDQLVETGEARLADEADLAIAGVHVRALPSLTPEI